jgi:hypothetical protein
MLCSGIPGSFGVAIALALFSVRNDVRIINKGWLPRPHARIACHADRPFHVAIEAGSREAVGASGTG